MKTETAPSKESSPLTGGFPEESFEHLYALERSSFWFHARNELILWALHKYFPEMRSFLEIGCGTGFVLNAVSAEFQHAELTGSDLFENALSFARKRTPQAKFVSFDATNIPFEKTFGVVGMFDVLEHIHEDEAVLGQIHKALVPQGGLLLTVPQHPSLWSQADEYAHHVRRYTRPELEAKLQHNGFELIRCTSFVSFLLPAMLAFRAMQGKSTKPYNPQEEMTTSSRFNGLLSMIMRTERALIESGIDMPAGGSLLAVCRAR